MTSYNVSSAKLNTTTHALCSTSLGAPSDAAVAEHHLKQQRQLIYRH